MLKEGREEGTLQCLRAIAHVSGTWHPKPVQTHTFSYIPKVKSDLFCSDVIFLCGLPFLSSLFPLYCSINLTEVTVLILTFWIHSSFITIYVTEPPVQSPLYGTILMREEIVFLA